MPSPSHDPYYLVKKHGIPIPVFDQVLAALAKCYEGPDGLTVDEDPRPRRSDWWDGKTARMANMRARGCSWREIAAKYKTTQYAVKRAVNKLERHYTERNKALVGQRFGDRVVTRYLGRNAKGQGRWEVKCKCGNLFRGPIANIRSADCCLRCSNIKRQKRKRTKT